ncbi:MAG: hypothetical protein LLG04_15535 [Parachlamydia sp.]|nr:hypothetical protein [Parachlamydia sp.]
MKKSIFAIFAIACTLSMPVCAQCFGIQLGPFELNLQGVNMPVVRVRSSTDPICYAIAHRKLLEMIMEWDEKVSSNEFKKTISDRPALSLWKKQRGPADFARQRGGRENAERDHDKIWRGSRGR